MERRMIAGSLQKQFLVRWVGEAQSDSWHDIDAFIWRPEDLAALSRREGFARLEDDLWYPVDLNTTEGTISSILRQKGAAAEAARAAAEAKAAEEGRAAEISKGSDLFREIASLAETSKLPFEDACELTVTAILQVGPTARTNEELQFHGTPPASIRQAARALGSALTRVLRWPLTRGLLVRQLHR